MNINKRKIYTDIQHPFTQTLPQTIRSFISRSQGIPSILLLHLPSNQINQINQLNQNNQTNQNETSLTHSNITQSMKTVIETISQQSSITLKQINQNSFQFSYQNYSQQYFSDEQFSQFKRNVCISSQMNSLFGNQNDWKHTFVYVDTFLSDIHFFDLLESYLKNAKIPLIICCYSNDLNTLQLKINQNSYLSSIVEIVSCV